jgi:hypothetical protein
MTFSILTTGHLTNSYSVVKTIVDRSSFGAAPSFNNCSDRNISKMVIAKQNTDYLFARQLSEEMESTIVRIQPGSKISNYDKISKVSGGDSMFQ